MSNDRQQPPRLVALCEVEDIGFERPPEQASPSRVPVDKLIAIEANALNGNVFSYNGRYWMIGNDSYARRFSYLYALDNRFRVTGERTFLDRGVEDHRVVCHEGVHHVWCNYADGTQMRYGKLDMDKRTLSAKRVTIEGFERREQEKNWCPFVSNGEVLVVYSLFPEFTVLRLKDRGVHERIFSARSAYLHEWVANHVDLNRLLHVGGGSNYISYGKFFVGTFHVKYVENEYVHCMIFFTPDFVVRKIVAIDYDETLFLGERLRRLKGELGQDKDERDFFVGGYRRHLARVAFTTGMFQRNDKFYISLGVNDLVTKVAVIGKEKIDRAIKPDLFQRILQRAGLDGFSSRIGK